MSARATAPEPRPTPPAALPTSLEELLDAHPMPAGWSITEAHIDEVSIGSRRVARAGIAARGAGGTQITGSAAALDRSPVARAFFELLERLAVVMADEPVAGDELRRDARSNGVALHSSWDRACRAAHLELVERHRVLESWAGAGAPEPMEPPAQLVELTTHRWRCAQLEAGAPDAVVVVVGFPKSGLDAPLARGFAAATDAHEAARRATEEAIQGLAFLQGESIPAEPPAPAPNPIFHLDHYLYRPHHALLEGWLDGARERPGLRAAELGAVRFVDLSPPDYGSLRVARALCDFARPLVFGEPREPTLAAPDPARFHPIA